jgi:hypothetical protein
MMRAELDAVLCSGPRRGKQFTYALLDERVPATRAAPLAPEEALAELAARYFTSHGPATIHDFAWWSGLTVADARQGLALAGSRLAEERFAGSSYWRAAAAPPVPEAPERPGAPEGQTAPDQTAYLLPSYDEYTVAYKARDLFFDQALDQAPELRDTPPFGHVIVCGGRVVGLWKPASGKRLVVSTRWFEEPTAAQRQAVAAAVARYGAFLGLPAELAP